MTWYRELTLPMRLLMIGVAKRLTVTEQAVLTVLVNQQDRMGVARVSMLWTKGLLHKDDRYKGDLLPYTRAGIDKAVNALAARGWIEKKHGYRYGGRELPDPALLVGSLVILSDAPEWLRPDGVGKAVVSTGVVRDRDQQPLKTRQDPQAKSTPVESGRKKRPLQISSSESATPVESGRKLTRVVVQVVKQHPVSYGSQRRYACAAKGCLAPMAYYSIPEYSMPAAARTYAAKVFTRHLDRDVTPADLRPNHEGDGWYSYTLKPAKKGRKA